MFWNHQCSMYSFTEATFFLQIPGEGTQHFPAFCKYKEGDANMEFQSGKYTRGSSTDLARWRCRIVEEQTNPVGWQGTGYLVSGNYHANINVHSIHRVFAEEQVSEEKCGPRQPRVSTVCAHFCLYLWVGSLFHTYHLEPTGPLQSPSMLQDLWMRPRFGLGTFSFQGFRKLGVRTL